MDARVDRLGIDHLDRYLVHWLMPHLNKFVGAFKAFAHLHDQGWIRSIRVSNFKPEHHSCRRCGQTPARVLIRWHLQIGNIVNPKSVNPTRIASTFDVLDMASISSPDDGSRLGPNPQTFNFIGR